ncbi:MAG TPA: TATA-box-binding protein [Thermoplasmata archaeon]|nr:TATA-box-binding protein [Thermoplasmata archaeon]HIH97452.1 TATA-box-binding protein [Thermoplasmata archaeon]
MKEKEKGKGRRSEKLGKASEIKIENIVATTAISNELDLNAIIEVLPDTKYEPEKFPGLTLRIKEPKAGNLLFHSGKVVCTGTKSLEDVELVIDQVCEKIKSVGFEVRNKPKIQVQNIVASADLHTTLNLSSIAIGLGLDRVEYEPEVFPGLVYRVEEPKVVMLLFSSGKIICSGARKKEDIEEAVNRLRERLALLVS